MSEKWPVFLCTNARGIYLYNNGFNVISSIKNNLEFNFYGITWNKESLFVTDGNFIRNLKEDCTHEIIPYKCSGLHGILYYNDFLIVPNSEINCIDCFDTKSEKLFRKSKVVGKQDLDHRNCIFGCNDGYYMSHHNHNNPSFVTKYDLNFNHVETYENVGRKTHNLYVVGDILYIVSSIIEGVVKYNLKTKTKESVPIDFYNLGKPNIKKFLRGLAKTKNNF